MRGDSQGKKHILGVAEGASENAASATSLLEDFVARGVDPKRRYLFVIDGSKALRGAINRVFRANSPVQRCRHHKIKNVCDKLPDDLADQAKSVMKPAYNLPWQEGITRLKKQAEWLETHYPGAAARLREGQSSTLTAQKSDQEGKTLNPTARVNSIYSLHIGPTPPGVLWVKAQEKTHRGQNAPFNGPGCLHASLPRTEKRCGYGVHKRRIRDHTQTRSALEGG